MKRVSKVKILGFALFCLFVLPLLSGCGGEEPLYRVRNGGVFQFVDRDGEVMLESDGLLRTQFSEELVPFLVDIEEGFGYMDVAGDTIIPPGFPRALGFSEGLAAVMVDGLWGFIDKEGEIIIAPQYASVDSFSDGLALVQEVSEKENELGKYGFIDEEGQVIIDITFDYASSFLDGIAAAVTEGQGGFIGKNGEFERLMPAGIFAYGPISQGLAPAADWEKYYQNELEKPFGFVDLDGNWIIEPRFDEVRGFSNSRAAVYITRDENSYWGYIDREGELIIEANYQFADDFYGDLAYVMTGVDVEPSRSGWIDSEGEWIFIDE